MSVSQSEKAELEAAGARRISLAASLHRAAMTGFLETIREVLETGRFTYVDRNVSRGELNRLMGI